MSKTAVSRSSAEVGPVASLLTARWRRERAKPALVDAEHAGAVQDNARVSPLMASLLREVRESRARIIAAADDERRRIERDLHDGAQQRLVALRIRLELAAEILGNEDSSTAALLRELGAEAEAALADVRSLARGVYPGLLADLGLVDALRGVALRGPLPLTIVAQAGRRYSPDVETATYFTCLEAIQNASKHAAGATGIRITLTERAGRLLIEISDDGTGFALASTNPGAGFTNMRDRVSSLGGELEIFSAPRAGTRLFAAIPLESPAAFRQ